MKTKLSLFLLVSCFFCLVSLKAQIPQGFNYQAIARDGSGNILPNTPLQAMMYVQSLSTGGTVYWKELHSSVTTNSFGLFTNPIDGLKGINYSQTTALLVEAIKEQQQQIESCKSQLQTLQEKVDKIEELLVKALVE